MRGAARDECGLWRDVHLVWSSVQVAHRRRKAAAILLLSAPLTLLARPAELGGTCI